MRKFWLVAGAAVLIAGCGEESGFEKAIKEKISKDGVCYGFSKENNAKVFDDFKLGTPVRVNIYSKDDEDPILIGLKNSGLLNISYEQEMFKRVVILETTDKGRKTNFWDRNNGTCIGHRTVAEITNWTEPSDNNGQKVTQVSYSWKLSGIPGWIDKQAFIAAGINGIDKPKESEIILVKTQKGWKARGL